VQLPHSLQSTETDEIICCIAEEIRLDIRTVNNSGVARL